jgi:hypothetical protein
MKHFLILISISGAFLSCTKTSISPQCWGNNCKEATFFYAPCSSINGYLVFKDAPNDTLLVIKSIPKKFRVDKIDVCVNVKEEESEIVSGNCDMKGTNFVKIRCVKSN